MFHVTDITGQRFGRLTVLSRAASKTNPGGSRRTMWTCRCDCGTERTIDAKSLKSGQTRSCGCLVKERLHKTQWTGDDITYKGAHDRVRRAKGSARNYSCVDCDGPAADWSWIGGCDTILRGKARAEIFCYYCPHPEHFVPRDRLCHIRHDRHIRDAALTQQS